MDKQILEKIKYLKNRFKYIEILGIVGSFSRNENFNDIDLLYKIKDEYLYKIDPFYFFTYLGDTKKEIEKILKIEIDLIDITTLNEIFKKYMLKDLINV